MPVSSKPLSKESPGKKPRKRFSAQGKDNDSVTLEDVARLAGVSTITVSRALNYPEKVAARTLDLVNRAIQKTGYVPNLLAGGLASRRTRLIAAIVPSITNQIYAETIQYFSDRLKQAGYQVLLGESGYAQTGEQDMISTILSRRPDGILLTGVTHTPDCRRKLLAANIPIVETWDLTSTPLDLVVGFSHDRIGEAVADFVLGKQASQIAIVSADDQRALQREEALINHLNAAGLSDIVSSHVSTPTDLHKGRQGLAELIDQSFTSGFIFCSSDTLAHGVLIEAQSRDIPIPEAYQVIGFGDQSFAADIYPALTTVRIDRSLMSKMAAEALLARIEDTVVDKNMIDVGFSIVERETTG